MHSARARWIGWTTLWMAATLTLTGAASAERPSAPRLLPRDTLAYFRVHDVVELRKVIGETTAGKLAQDEQIQPLVDQLWDAASQAFAPVEAELGLSLNELIEVPRGELCVALVAPDRGNTALVTLVEVGEQSEAARKLWERADQAMREGGAVKETEQHAGVDLHIYRFRGDRERLLVQWQHEGVLALVTDLELGKALLDVWEGVAESPSTLADNRKFTAIMQRSAGTRNERPQMTFYVDPLALARRAGRGNLTFQATLALLEPLGLDGLKAVGGSVVLGSEEFESVVHLHVTLANPRNGVLSALAMESGDVTPEGWVPGDVASYASMHWDAEQTYDAIEAVYDKIRGEAEWETMVQRRISDPLGVDFREALIGAMDGRMTMVTWMEKPARLNSQSRLIGVKLKDSDRFRATLTDLMNKFSANWDSKAFGGMSYYQFRGPRPAEAGAPERAGDAGEGRSRATRRPELVIGLLGDYLLLADSSKLLQQAVIAKGAPANSLAQSLDYKLIASKIKRHSSGEKPGMIYFDRPEEGMRLLYDLATGDTMRENLGRAAEGSPVLGALHSALQANPLPPFHRIARYLAPRGGMMISDDTGLHYTMFSLRRE